MASAPRSLHGLGLLLPWGFPGGARGEEPACRCRRHKRCGFDPWAKNVPCRRMGQPIPMFLPGESHKQRSLAVYRPWGHKESDTAERLSPSWIQHLFESDEPHHEHFENEMKPSDVN